MRSTLEAPPEGSSQNTAAVVVVELAAGPWSLLRMQPEALERSRSGSLPVVRSILRDLLARRAGPMASLAEPEPAHRMAQVGEQLLLEVPNRLTQPPSMRRKR